MIKFRLPKVSLKVYDILDRVVCIVFKNHNIKASVINYKFDASEIAPGIYFYTLKINDDAPVTNKMIFVK